VELEPLEPG
jgi:hypothetical protein